MAAPVRITIVGAGSIGGFVAARLARAGHDVSLCVRTPFDQLIVDELDGERTTFNLLIHTRPEGVTPAEWVMVATKAHQTAAAGAMIERACGPSTRAVVVMQNGVEHHERVAPFVGSTPVLPCIVRCGAEAVAPGHIVHHGFATFEVPDGALTEQLERVFDGTGMELVPVDDMVTTAWLKLISNVTCSPLTALTRRRLEILRDDRIADLATGLAEECLRVGAAVGADVSPAMAAPIVTDMRTVSPRMGSSMMYDQLAGRPTEYEALTGAVVRYGRRHGIPTPLNDAMYALLAVADRDWAMPGSL